MEYDFYTICHFCLCVCTILGMDFVSLMWVETHGLRVEESWASDMVLLHKEQRSQ